MNTENQETCSQTNEPRSIRGRWNPYVVGAALGVLSWVVFAVVNHPLGISTALSSASSLCATPVLGQEAVARNEYWATKPFQWNYGMLFVVGTFFGSLISALVSRTFRVETVPSVWRNRFGGSAGKRLLVSFLGGISIMYGARLAGGCTSGHGISGSLQLALSSWIFFLVLFGAGIVTAWVLFGQASPKR